MRRYMKLIKKLLIHAEQRGNGEDILPPELPDYTDKEIHYHVGLCGQAGYLDIRSVSGAEEAFTRYTIGNLTWAGHEALDGLR